MARTLARLLTLAGWSLAIQACGDGSLGSKGRPFTMYFIPSSESGVVTRGGEDIASHVSKAVSRRLYGKDEGFFAKSIVPTNYVAVVEAFGTGRADFAALTTYGYVLAKDIKKYDLEVVLTVLRGAGERTYRGQVLARADSGIRKLEDLEGKNFAYVDPASTTGFFLPSHLFSEKKITLGQTTFAQRHDNVVTMVYQKQVDGGATYSDARSRVETQFPDVLEKLVVVGTTEEVPNDPWAFRSSIDPGIKAAVREALVAYSETPEGKANLGKMYTVNGLVPAEDSVYSKIREIILKGMEATERK